HFRAAWRPAIGARPEYRTVRRRGSKRTAWPAGMAQAVGVAGSVSQAHFLVDDLDVSGSSVNLCSRYRLLTLPTRSFCLSGQRYSLSETSRSAVRPVKVN